MAVDVTPVLANRKPFCGRVFKSVEIFHKQVKHEIHNAKSLVKAGAEFLDSEFLDVCLPIRSPCPFRAHACLLEFLQI